MVPFDLYEATSHTNCIVISSLSSLCRFNILTQEEVQQVLDHNYFDGQCEYVYNGDWRELRYDPTCEEMYYATDEKYFRKPYNYHLYQFLVRKPLWL